MTDSAVKSFVTDVQHLVILYLRNELSPTRSPMAVTTDSNTRDYTESAIHVSLLS